MSIAARYPSVLEAMCAVASIELPVWVQRAGQWSIVAYKDAGCWETIVQPRASVAAVVEWNRRRTRDFPPADKNGIQHAI